MNQTTEKAGYLYDVYTTTLGEPIAFLAKADNYDGEQVAADQQALIEQGFKANGALFTPRYPIDLGTLKFLLQSTPLGAILIKQCTVTEIGRHYANLIYLCQRAALKLRENIGKLSAPAVEAISANLNEQDQAIFNGFIAPYCHHETRCEKFSPEKAMAYEASVIHEIVLGQIILQNDDGKYNISPCWLACLSCNGKKRIQPLLPEYLGKASAPALAVEEFPNGIDRYDFRALPWKYFNELLYHFHEHYKYSKTPDIAYITYCIKSSSISYAHEDWQYALRSTWRAGSAIVRHPFEEDGKTAILLNNHYNERKLIFFYLQDLKISEHFLLDNAKRADDYLQKFVDEDFGYYEDNLEQVYEFHAQDYRSDEIQLCPTVTLGKTNSGSMLSLHTDFWSPNWKLIDGGLVAKVGPLRVKHTKIGETIEFIK